MNTIVAGIFGALAGLVVGVVLFDRGPGIESLPIITAIGGAIVAVSGARLARRGSAPS